MTDKLLKYLLSHVRREPCTRARDIYQAVLETALVRPDRAPYQPEIDDLLQKYPYPADPAPVASPAGK